MCYSNCVFEGWSGGCCAPKGKMGKPGTHCYEEPKEKEEEAESK